MKAFNIFLLTLMLCAQVFAVWPDPPLANASCPQLQTDCTASMAALSQGREFRGSCTPEKWSDSEYKVSFQCQWVGQENSWISCYNHMCTVPLCSNGAILNTSTFTCEGGTTSTSNPPQGACEGPACCVDGYTWNAITKGCDKNPDTPTNTYNPQATECAPEWDACVSALVGKEGYSCFKIPGNTNTRDSSGALVPSTNMGTSICLYSSHTGASNCSVCGSSSKYSMDKDWIVQNPTGTNSSTSSGSPGLDVRQKECQDRNGKWEVVEDGQKTIFANTTDKYSTYWKCTTADRVDMYGTGGMPLYTSSTQQQQQNLNCGGTTGIACESTQISVDNSLKTLVVDIKGFSDKFKEIFSEVNATDQASHVSDIISIPEWELIKAIWLKMKSNSKTACKIKITGGWRPKVTFQGHVIDMKFEDLDTLFCDMAYVLRSIFFTLAVFSVLHFIMQR